MRTDPRISPAALPLPRLSSILRRSGSLDTATPVRQEDGTFLITFAKGTTDADRQAVKGALADAGVAMGPDNADGTVPILGMSATPPDALPDSMFSDTPPEG